MFAWPVPIGDSLLPAVGMQIRLPSWERPDCDACLYVYTGVAHDARNLSAATPSADSHVPTGGGTTLQAIDKRTQLTHERARQRALARHYEYRYDGRELIHCVENDDEACCSCPTDVAHTSTSTVY